MFTFFFQSTHTEHSYHGKRARSNAGPFSMAFAGRRPVGRAADAGFPCPVSFCFPQCRPVVVESLGCGHRPPCQGAARRGCGGPRPICIRLPGLRSSTQSALAFVENPPGPGGCFAAVAASRRPAPVKMFFTAVAASRHPATLACFAMVAASCHPAPAVELLWPRTPSPVHRCRPFHVCSDSARSPRTAFGCSLRSNPVRPYVKTARPPCPGPKRTRYIAAVACQCKTRPPSAEVLTMV